MRRSKQELETKAKAVRKEIKMTAEEADTIRRHAADAGMREGDYLLWRGLQTTAPRRRVFRSTLPHDVREAMQGLLDHRALMSRLIKQLQDARTPPDAQQHGPSDHADIVQRLLDAVHIVEAGVQAIIASLRAGHG